MTISSPLEEVPFTSLDELYCRNPLDLSDDDLDKMVIEQRRARENWLKLEAEGKTKGAKKVSKAKPKLISAPTDIDLGDLGL